ncbi:MAG: hypothetical protein AB8B47_10700 [Roseobacter sp.]
MHLPFGHVLSILLILAPFSASAAPRPVQLAPMQERAAELVIVAADGKEARYSPDTLEEMPTYQLTTTTPWREKPANFEGILLKDLLKAHGLHTASAIRVTAENDFTSIIQRAVWEEVEILVATRVNGKAHSRRARGPIQFVIDKSSYESSSNALEEHLVWMAARIEAVQ